MNPLKKAICVLSIGIVTGGCGISPHPRNKTIKSQSGENCLIVSKRYEPEKTTLEEHLSAFGTVIIRYTDKIIDDEDYVLILNCKKKYETTTVYVSKEAYDSLKIGEKFDTTTWNFKTTDHHRCEGIGCWGYR